MLKLNKVTVAVAVGMALAAPTVSIAEGGFYGSVRIGLGYGDIDGVAIEGAEDVAELEDVIRFRNWGSRMGYAGERELDRGLTAFGKYEFGVDTDSDDTIDAITTRKAYVGLKGGFGSILIGQNYHTFYNNVMAAVDQPWWGSCNGCISYTGRSANGLTYAGSFGIFKGGATVYLESDADLNDPEDDGEDDLDGIELGASFVSGPVNIGVGVQDLADAADPTFGLAVSGSAGLITYAANVTVNGDATGIDVFLGYSSYYVDLGVIDNDLTTASGFTAGYTLGLGENTLAWFELSATDSGISGEDVDTDLRMALKYDWN